LVDLPSESSVAGASFIDGELVVLYQDFGSDEYIIETESEGQVWSLDASSWSVDGFASGDNRMAFITTGADKRRAIRIFQNNQVEIHRWFSPDGPHLYRKSLGIGPWPGGDASLVAYSVVDDDPQHEDYVVVRTEVHFLPGTNLEGYPLEEIPTSTTAGIAFSGKLMSFVDTNNDLLVWNLDYNEIVGLFHHVGETKSLFFTDNNKLVYIQAPDELVILDLDTGQRERLYLSSEIEISQVFTH
jgi:hypothetical protein